MDVMTPDFIPAVERIYRDLARPEAPKPIPTSIGPPSTGKVDRDEVQEIIQRKRIASSEELQSIITNAKEYGLTRSERDQLSVDLTIQIAQARRNRGRPDDPNARFIAQILNLIETPFGLIDRSFLEDSLVAASQNICRCKRHQPPRCGCWSAQRAALLQFLSAEAEKSAEGWAAARIYASLEELETAASLSEFSGSTG